MRKLIPTSLKSLWNGKNWVAHLIFPQSWDTFQRIYFTMHSFALQNVSIMYIKKRIRFENTPHRIPYGWFFSTYDLDLLTWPRYCYTWPTCWNSSPYVCLFCLESGNTQTDRQIHKLCQNYYTRHVTDVGCKYIVMKYTMMYMKLLSLNAKEDRKKYHWNSSHKKAGYGHIDTLVKF